MTIYNFPQPIEPREGWNPGPGPHKSFGELWDSGELPRPLSARETLHHVLNDVPSGELPEYRLGRQYAACLISALAAAADDMHNAADEALAVADQILKPLGEVADPELLRDFIAGTAREIAIAVENMLSSLN